MTLVENVGYDCPSRFPFNMLRNLAVQQAREEYLLLLDIDNAAAALTRV